MEFKASSVEGGAKQRKDTAIATILQKATIPLNDRQYNCSTFGVNPMTREQTQKLGPEVLGFWYNWEQFTMKDCILIRKWYTPGKDGYQELRCTRETLGAVQQGQKDKFFKRTYGKPYQKDDQVWLFSPQLAKSKKFYPPGTDPYTVLRKINEVNYEICSEKNKKKNQIVHYNRLKPFKPRSENDHQPLRSST